MDAEASSTQAAEAAAADLPAPDPDTSVTPTIASNTGIDNMLQSYLKILELTPEQRKLLSLAALGVVLLFPGAVRYLASLLLRVAGTAVGIGLGLGLAAHIHDALDRMAGNHLRQVQQQQQQQRSASSSSLAAAKDAAHASMSTPRTPDGQSAAAAGSASRISRRDLLDEDSYHALMASAGYDVPDALLRGQILRTAGIGIGTANKNATANAAQAVATSDNGVQTQPAQHEQQPKRPITAATILENTVASGPNAGLVPNPLYPASVPDAFDNFTSTPTPRGPSTLQRMYPSLHKDICKELGTFMDLIMRDFIHCWFCTIDTAVLYEDEKERRRRLAEEKERQAKKAKMMEVLEEGRKAMEGGGSSSNNLLDTATAVADAAGGTSTSIEAGGSTTGTAIQQQEEPKKEEETNAAQMNKHSLMVLSTAPLRPSPFPEALYATMATLFGSLAVNARDNVNIMELVLVKIVRILSLNIKTYRELRKIAVSKHRRRLASVRGRVRKDTTGSRQSSATARAPAADSTSTIGSAELRSATSHDRLNAGASTVAIAADTDEQLQRNSSRGSLASPPDSGNGTFEDGSVPRARGQSFGVSSTSGDNGALPSESDITEIAMIREYLLAGKLHRALTFGMDVPSLLFADPHGRDCPPPPMDDEEENDEHSDVPKGEGASTSGVLEDDDVLYARLFSPKSQLLVESELDYCRVISHRLIKETTTKVDFDSPTLRSMAVEMVATCVLAPIMNCFSPDMINYGLVKVLEPYTQPSSTASTFASESEESKIASMDSDMDLMRGWDQSSSADLGALEETALAERDEADLLEDMDEPDELALVETFDAAESGAAISANNDASELPRDESCQNILTLLTMSIIGLSDHLDFDEIKLFRESNTEATVNWDAPSCRAAVRRLVLVVEAALLHGLRPRRDKSQSKEAIGDGDDEILSEQDGLDQDLVEGDMALLDDEKDEEQAEDAAHLHPKSIIILLMELTENLDSFEKSFEKRVAEEEGRSGIDSLDESDDDDMSRQRNDWRMPVNEVSSLRTLIAAWLHTGQLYRTLSVFLQSRSSILRPFYHSFAFMRDAEASSGFVRQLKILDGIDVLVDTAAVLRYQSLDLRGEMQLESNDADEEAIADELDGGDSYFASDGLALGNSGEDADHQSGKLQGLGGSLVGGVRANLRSNRQRLSRLVGTDLANVASSLTGSGGASAPATSSPSSPLTAAVHKIHVQHQRQNFDAPHLTFSRNAAFAENLRKERERRMKSWAKVAAASHQHATVDMIVHTRGLTDRDVQIHRELHGLARAFYSGSVVVNISRNTLPGVNGGTPQISMENVANRRRFEVPDDDSSFLLRASSRRLTPLGVTRNSRDHSQSFINFLATYQEPILHPKSKRYKGGRFIRQVKIQFFPSDRTATVGYMKEDSRTLSSLDGAKSQSLSSSPSWLSDKFQKTRHLCQRHMPAGSGNVLTASMTPSLMDSDDFVSTPRVGKAIDFVYRFHLFEKPIVNIGGKQFTVQDASLKGPHKADASALEISDATLSYALLTLGDSVVPDGDDPSGDSAINEEESSKKMTVGGLTLQRGDEGRPTVIFMKIKSSQSSRAASDAGSGTEQAAASSSIMRPFRPSFLRAALLQTSTRQEAQLQCLLTCVKSGSARNATKARTEALIQPYLTLLEFAVSKKREKQSILLRDLKLGIPALDVSQLRRNAILNPRFPSVLHSLSTVTVEGAIRAKPASNDLIGSPAMILYKIKVAAIVEAIDLDNPEERFFREEWVILRPFRDFLMLHKHLKKQVNENESSGNAGAKLVGAAAAALTFQSNQRQRRALMPSLGQAKEVGALGVTQKSIEKRKEILSTYLAYLTDPKHLLHQCTEINIFLGASDAFPDEIDPNAGPDRLGRIHLKRMPLSKEVVVDDMLRLGLGTSHVNISGILSENTDLLSRAAVSPRGMPSPRLVPTAGSVGDLSSVDMARSRVGSDHGTTGVSVEKRSSVTRGRKEKGSSLQKVRDASIRSQMEQVSLAAVRNGMFRFVRYLFDLDNKSFFRSRILSALKTMSLAVTSAHDFHDLLFKAHKQYASAEAMAGWIFVAREILWPNGVFFDPAPEQDPEELKKQMEQAKSLLMAMFPEQMRAVLSQDIAENGIDVLHEMLQNRVVLKSIAYQLMDDAWGDIFPDLRDVVSGSSAVSVSL